MKRRFIGISICIVAFSVYDCPANGFKNPPDGVAGFGRFGGKAYTGDASAVFHNPANLMDLDETEFLFTLTNIYAPAEYDSPNGAVSASSKDNFAALPNFYFASPSSDHPEYTVGIGVNIPFGRSTTWAKDSPFQFAGPYFAFLQVTNINPTVAVKLNDRIHLGLGFDLYYSDIAFRQQYPWFLASTNGAAAPGKMEFEADGVGYGGNLGVTMSISERQRLAVTYRSAVDVDYEGDFRIGSIPADRAVPGDVSGKSTFKTEFDYPAIAAVGYGIQLTEKLRIEADAEWLEFSGFGKLDLDIGSNNGKLLFSNTGQVLLPPSIPQNWHNSWTFGVGLDYDISDNTTVRAGYSYIESPVPDETFLPAIVDADKNVFTIGIDTRRGASFFSFSYAIVIPEKRRIRTNQVPAFNGDYDFLTHLVGLNYQYRF